MMPLYYCYKSLYNNPYPPSSGVSLLPEAEVTQSNSIGAVRWTLPDEDLRANSSAPSRPANTNNLANKNSQVQTKFLIYSSFVAQFLCVASLLFYLMVIFKLVFACVCVCVSCSNILDRTA